MCYHLRVLELRPWYGSSVGCVYVCLCVKMCIFVCMYVGTCLCICVDMGVYMCIHVIICICVLVYFYVLCVCERYKEHTGANVLARRSPRDP